MRRTAVGLACLAIFLSFSNNRVLAQSTEQLKGPIPVPENPAPPDQQAPATAQPADSSKAEKAATRETHDHKSIAAAVAKATFISPVTWAVGLPICIARDTGEQLTINAESVTEGRKHKALCAPYIVFMAPVTALCGVGRGFVLSGVHAFGDKPFTKESVCLGDNYDN